MKSYKGPLLVALAAGLWAADALFRTELTTAIPSASIVLFEHLIGFVILSPFLWKNRKELKKLSPRDWSILGVLTIFSSVLGTLLFTEALARSFAVFDYATPILLQKLQPVFVVALAGLFLKEKISFRFVMMVVLALVGAYMISFGTNPVELVWTGKQAVFLLSLGAVACWGSGTILSKQILKKISFSTATALRFLCAIPASLIAVWVLKEQYSLFALEGGQWLRFLIIAFTTGAGAVFIYYRGLQLTQAKVATIAELTFPVISILIAITALNPYGEPQALSLANSFGIAILLIAVLIISLDYHVPDRKQPDVAEI